MSRPVNLGSQYLEIKAVGADEALEKLNLLLEKLNEANALIKELASSEVTISVGSPPTIFKECPTIELRSDELKKGFASTN